MDYYYDDGTRACGPVDEEGLAKMMEPFHTTKPEGLGVGLAICRSIVEDHGGRLWPTRNPDHGLTLHFTIPTGDEGETA